MIKKPLIFCIKTYKKLVSPLLRKSCRFYPSCSEYAIEAIDKHGPLKGLKLALTRLLRCNGYFKGGLDPVN